MRTWRNREKILLVTLILLRSSLSVSIKALWERVWYIYEELIDMKLDKRGFPRK